MNSEHKSEEKIGEFLNILKQRIGDVRVDSIFRGTVGLIVGSSSDAQRHKKDHTKFELTD